MIDRVGQMWYWPKVTEEETNLYLIVKSYVEENNLGIIQYHWFLNIKNGKIYTNECEVTRYESCDAIKRFI